MEEVESCWKRWDLIGGSGILLAEVTTSCGIYLSLIASAHHAPHQGTSSFSSHYLARMLSTHHGYKQLQRLMGRGTEIPETMSQTNFFSSSC